MALASWEWNSWSPWLSSSSFSPSKPTIFFYFYFFKVIDGLFPVTQICSVLKTKRAIYPTARTIPLYASKAWMFGVVDSGWNFSCKTSWDQAFLPRSTFQSAPKKGEYLCAGGLLAAACLNVGSKWAVLQLDGLLLASCARAAASPLQPRGAMVMLLGYTARENQDPNGKLFGRLKLLLHICPPLEKVLSVEVMKYCRRGKCSQLSKDPRASKWTYMGQQRIAWFEEPNTVLSIYRENRSTTVPKTVKLIPTGQELISLPNLI